MLGPLLARFKHAVILFPGGCDIGNRPIDLHLTGLGNWAKSILGSCALELNSFVDNDIAMEFYSKLNFKKYEVKIRKEI